MTVREARDAGWVPLKVPPEELVADCFSEVGCDVCEKPVTECWYKAESEEILCDGCRKQRPVEEE